MPNYTCVQSMTREYYKPVVTPASCDAQAGAGHQRWSTDRLRLDVAVTSAREIYSWAGARQFEDRELTEIIGGGPIGTGAFGAFLNSIFGTEGATFTYIGEARSDGRSVLHYSYRISKDASHYQVRAGEGWVVTPYEGDFLVDGETFDLLRLTIRTGELPLSTGTCEIRTRMDYGRVPIGELELLLPRNTTQHFRLRSGIESENTSTFSACREYRGESTVRFTGDAPAGAAGPADTARAFDRLPADLPVVVALAAPLDTWKAAGGDVIPLRLAKPIVDASKRTLVPAGTAIQARIVRVQRFFTKPQRVTLVMLPETIERAGTRQPFPVAAPAHETQFTGNHVVLRKGYHTTWYTAGPVITTP